MSSKKLQKSEIFQRIEIFRQERGYKFQGNFADAIGVSQSYYTEVKAGRSNANIDFIIGIANAFPDADLVQIITGAESGRVKDQLAEYGRKLDDDIEMLLQTLDELDNDKKKHVISLFNSLIKLLF